MIVNLTDVLINEGQVQELAVPYDADIFTGPFGTFPIREKSLVALKLSNIGRSEAFVEGSMRLTLILACDRCLRAVEHTFDLSFAGRATSPDQTGCEADEDGLSAFQQGYNFDVDRAIDNEIMLAWPMKVLCRPDCKGICKICGKDRNEGDCGCDDHIPDPRMAAIKDIFRADKGV